MILRVWEILSIKHVVLFVTKDEFKVSSSYIYSKKRNKINALSDDIQGGPNFSPENLPGILVEFLQR